MHINMFITSEFLNQKSITIHLYNKNILKKNDEMPHFAIVYEIV